MLGGCSGVPRELAVRVEQHGLEEEHGWRWGRVAYRGPSGSLYVGYNGTRTAWKLTGLFKQDEIDLLYTYAGEG